jgi:DNA-binding MarR family transcriptional regulator
MHAKIDPDAFGYMMTETARLLRAEFERRLSDAGFHVTPSDARTLGYIVIDQGSRQNTIAERMGVEPMTTSESIDRLEHLGLVRRTQDPTDRRAKRVATTERADDLLADINLLAGVLCDDVRRGVSDPEWRSFLEVLHTLRDNLRTSHSERQSTVASATGEK